MKDIIWSIIGIIIAVCGIVYISNLIYLKKKGKLVLAEVVSVTEKKDRKGRITAYIHKLRFEIDGKVYEKDDRSGFSQPFKVGEKQLIYVNPTKTESFEYENEVKKNIVITGAMIVIALVFSVKWIISYFT